ncbi:ABC-type transport system, involved in lipoprotein release, permease component [Opitutaceae bacterium TAV1]|nr:ABC-type transport system, involved in lipoprotein release, permease component [Opitutaceae bacterium TAV1]
MFRRMVLRALTNRFRRVSVVFVALTVGAAIVCAMSAVYFDINAKMSRELRTFGANFYIGSAQADTLAQTTYDDIIATAPAGLVVDACPWLYGTARAELSRIAIAGTSFESLRPLSPWWQLNSGSWIGVDFDDRNAMIGHKLAARLELRPGQPVTLLRDGASEKRTFNIKGAVETGDATDNLLIVNLDAAQAWLGQPGRITHALLRLDTDDPARIDAWAADLRQRHPDLDIRPIRKVSASEGGVLEKIKGLMGLVSLVILVLSTLCVNTTLTAIISERAREFALQKALGARNRAIVLQILAETGIIVTVAIVAGCALGYLLAQILGQAVFSSSIDFRAPVLPIAATLSLLVALVAAIVPTRRAMQIEPAAILKGE